MSMQYKEKVVNFQQKKSIFLLKTLIVGSNEYPQSMFWNKNKKNRYTPVLLYKSGVQGGGYTLHGHVFLMFWLY